MCFILNIYEQNSLPPSRRIYSQFQKYSYTLTPHVCVCLPFQKPKKNLLIVMRPSACTFMECTVPTCVVCLLVVLRALMIIAPQQNSIYLYFYMDMSCVRAYCCIWEPVGPGTGSGIVVIVVAVSQANIECVLSSSLSVYVCVCAF